MTVTQPLAITVKPLSVSLTLDSNENTCREGLPRIILTKSM